MSQFNFEHFWSQNKTTGHVLLSTVCVSMDNDIFPSDKLRDLGPGIYCNFDPRIARMNIVLNTRNFMEGSVWRSIKDKDPKVLSLVQFDDSIWLGVSAFGRSGVMFP